jgi:predicted O-methyltransferase YrrM
MSGYQTIRAVASKEMLLLYKNITAQEWLEVSTRLRAIEGHLSTAEAKCLYHLAKDCGGIIVEIGSWKGKSTICLALGSKAAGKGKVFAIDPHSFGSEKPFRENLKRARVEDIVGPLVMTSEEASKQWSGNPISLLWIDGAHDYENVKKDFTLWEPYLSDKAIVVFHDVIFSLPPLYDFSGVRKVIEEYIFRSRRFSDVGLCHYMLHATKSWNSENNRPQKYQALLLWYFYIHMIGYSIVFSVGKIPEIIRIIFAIVLVLVRHGFGSTELLKSRVSTLIRQRN